MTKQVDYKHWGVLAVVLISQCCMMVLNFNKITWKPVLLWPAILGMPFCFCYASGTRFYKRPRVIGRYCIIGMSTSVYAWTLLRPDDYGNVALAISSSFMVTIFAVRDLHLEHEKELLEETTNHLRHQADSSYEKAYKIGFGAGVTGNMKDFAAMREKALAEYSGTSPEIANRH